MKKEPTTLKADPADPEDFDATPRAMDRALKARLIRRTRTGLGLSRAASACRRERCGTGSRRGQRHRTLPSPMSR